MTVEREFSFARHTTIGCGGRAAAAIYPKNEGEIAKSLAFLKRESIPYFVLGAGANVLPQDEDFQGAVIRLTNLNSLFCYRSYLYAGAGVPLGTLLKFAREHGLSGFEPLTGIPATVGGATAMNAGIAVRHIGELAVRAVAVKDGEILLLNRDECAFREKDSAFLREKMLVTGVLFAGVPSSKEHILQETNTYRARRAHLPKGRSMGCVFVNPKGDSAGRIIEQCGLKGTRMGGAFVAKEHANFIINEGGRAGDVARLIDKVKEEVRLRTGIALREEIKRIPHT